MDAERVVDLIMQCDTPSDEELEQRVEVPDGMMTVAGEEMVERFVSSGKAKP